MQLNHTASPFEPAPGRAVFHLGPNQRVVIMQPIADDPSFQVAGVFNGERLVRMVDEPAKVHALLALCVARLDDTSVRPEGSATQRRAAGPQPLGAAGRKSERRRDRAGR